MVRGGEGVSKSGVWEGLRGRGNGRDMTEGNGGVREGEE